GPCRGAEQGSERPEGNHESGPLRRGDLMGRSKIPRAALQRSEVPNAALRLPLPPGRRPKAVPSAALQLPPPAGRRPKAVPNAALRLPPPPGGRGRGGGGGSREVLNCP